MLVRMEDATCPMIAVVDDELRFCRALARLLKTHGFDVMTFTDGDDFLAACGSRLPDCLLLDLHMPDRNGFEILERVAERHLPVLVLTGHDQPGNPERVRALGALDYVLKPVSETRLMDAIHAAIGCSPGAITGTGRGDRRAGPAGRAEDPLPVGQ
jgi:FixJ family two-component response regulator